MADVMAVSAEGELVRGPTASLLHSGEFTAAEEGALTPATDIGLGALGAVFPGYSLYRVAGAPGLPSWFREPPESPMLDAATARQRIADSGFKLEVPDSGIREGALKILLDAKREQRLRDSVLARTPERIGPKRSPWWPDWAQRAAPGALRVGSGCSHRRSSRARRREASRRFLVTRPTRLRRHLPMARNKAFASALAV
jgi:hypothetical protein